MKRVLEDNAVEMLNNLGYKKCELSIPEQHDIITEFLRSFGEAFEEEGENMYSELNYKCDANYGNIRERFPILNDYTCVYSFGGGINGGENVERLYLYKPKNILFYVSGWYESYNGTEWENEFQIIPELKSVTCLAF
jgi:hypothetical protein